MRGLPVVNREALPLQQSGLLAGLVPRKRNPFDEMSIAVTGPDGPGNVNPSALLYETESSPAPMLAPKVDSKQGAPCATAPAASTSAARDGKQIFMGSFL